MSTTGLATAHGVAQVQRCTHVVRYLWWRMVSPGGYTSTKHNLLKLLHADQCKFACTSTAPSLGANKQSKNVCRWRRLSAPVRAEHDTPLTRGSHAVPGQTTVVVASVAHSSADATTGLVRKAVLCQDNLIDAYAHVKSRNDTFARNQNC